MPVNAFNTLWISTHLLYPNSAQARDVFKQIVDSLTTKKKEINEFKTFIRLAAVYDKIPAIKSGASYFEFKNEKLNYWPLALQKCHKTELLIILGTLVYRLNMHEVARAVKTTENRARYLLNQAVRKVIPLEFDKLELLSDKINLRKYHQEQTSYLFVHENIIEFAFRRVDEVTHKRVEKSIAERQDFQSYKAKVQDFYNELTTVEAVSSYESMLEKSEIESALPTRPIEDSSTAKWVVTATFTICIMAAVLFIRPRFVSQVLEIKENPVVEIEEIKIVRATKETETTGDTLDAVELNAPLAGILAASSSSAQATALSVAANAQAKATGATSSSATITVPAATTAATATNAIVAVEKPKPKQTGGLFRGDLTVNDIEPVTRLLREKIVILGGKKAGEVELGWSKTERVTYFHFSLPEEGVEELRAYMQQFGKYSLVFENHPRQMPAGVKRIIIEVKESE